MGTCQGEALGLGQGGEGNIGLLSLILRCKCGTVFLPWYMVLAEYIVKTLLMEFCA